MSEKCLITQIPGKKYILRYGDNFLALSISNIKLTLEKNNKKKGSDM